MNNSGKRSDAMFTYEGKGTQAVGQKSGARRIAGWLKDAKDGVGGCFRHNRAVWIAAIIAAIIIIGGLFWAKSAIDSERAMRVKAEAEARDFGDKLAAEKERNAKLEFALKKIEDEKKAGIEADKILKKEILFGVVNGTDYQEEFLRQINDDPAKFGYKEEITDETKKSPGFKRWAKGKAKDIVVRAGLVLKDGKRINIRKEAKGCLSLVYESGNDERISSYMIRADGEGITEPLAVIRLAPDSGSVEPRKKIMFYERFYWPPKPLKKAAVKKSVEMRSDTEDKNYDHIFDGFEPDEVDEGQEQEGKKRKNPSP